MQYDVRSIQTTLLPIHAKRNNILFPSLCLSLSLFLALALALACEMTTIMHDNNKHAHHQLFFYSFFCLRDKEKQRHQSLNASTTDIKTHKNTYPWC